MRPAFSTVGWPLRTSVLRAPSVPTQTRAVERRAPRWLSPAARGLAHLEIVPAGRDTPRRGSAELTAGPGGDDATRDRRWSAGDATGFDDDDAAGRWIEQNKQTILDELKRAR